jgi:hypothetical protein
VFAGSNDSDREKERTRFNILPALAADEFDGGSISLELKLPFTTTMPSSTHPKISGCGAGAKHRTVG